MAVANADTFFERLEESDLLSEKQLAEARKVTAELSDSRKIAWRLVKKDLLTQWQAEQVLRGRQKQLHLGKYRLIDKLGAGAMGTVLLAEHTQMRRRVAIKTLLHHGHGRESVERFLSEARNIAALNHRNIIQAYDVDTEGDIYYLVMEYVQGQNLQDLVDSEGALPYETIADFISQASEGLAHAHDQGMIHRDVKPANLLVDDQGTLKILDLGVAQMTADDKPKTDDGVLGTPDYVSPEQVQNEEVEPRSDIYSLGCTMYFLLTGQPPFGGTVPERLMKHLKKEPQSVLKFRADCPPGLARICRKMMAKRPDERFRSASSVVEALDIWSAEFNGGSGSNGNGAAAKSNGESPPPVRRPPKAKPVENASDDESSDDKVFAIVESDGDEDAQSSSEPKTPKDDGILVNGDDPVASRIAGKRGVVARACPPGRCSEA